MAAKRGLPQKRRMRHDRHFVDELTRRTGDTIGRMLPVDSITSNSDQPRSSLGSLDDLVASVAHHGVLEPLLVRRRSGGGYELVAGERRLHAAMEAGLTEVPCIELHVEDQQALEIALIENLQRKDLTPFEEAEGYRTLVEKYTYTHDQVAGALGRSRVTITEALRLLAIPEHIRDLCRHADINAKGILLEIARLSTPELMAQLVQEIVEHDLDRAAVRRRRQELEGRTVPAPTGGDPAIPAEPPSAQRPFVVRFRHPERQFSVSISFRELTSEPEPSEVIAALEEMIRELRRSEAEARGTKSPGD